MRFVSILGDSISTFEGYNPYGYAVFYDKEMQIKNGLQTVYDTWWAKVNQALRAYLCVNNSYSGSRVTGTVFPAAVSEERIDNLTTSERSPDIILVYLGFNDFGVGVKVRKTIRDKIGVKDLYVFEDAYNYMLKAISRKFPYSNIICGTLMRTTIKGEKNWIFPETFGGTKLEEYNDAIRRVVNTNRCYLADVSAMNIRYETLDGSHPTAFGHLVIADAWIKCISDLNL